MPIREATAADAHMIATIHVQSWQAAYQGIIPRSYLQSLSVERREAMWRDLLQKKASKMYVEESQGVMRGWINIGKCRDTDATAHTGELWALYVDPAHWSQGIGSALWQEGANRLLRMGYAEVTLWVLRDNHRAIRFYQAMGFEIEQGKEQTIKPGGAHLTEVRLRRKLSD